MLEEGTSGLSHKGWLEVGWFNYREKGFWQRSNRMKPWTQERARKENAGSSVWERPRGSKRAVGNPTPGGVS